VAAATTANGARRSAAATARTARRARRRLAVASRAPSGTNTQPWKVYVLTGRAKTELSRKIMAAHNDPEERATHSEE